MTNPRLFLNTGYIIALELTDDQHHGDAVRHWEILSGTSPDIVTTSCVFEEIVTFLNSRNVHSKAIDVGNRLLADPHVTIIHVDESLFHTGWMYFQQRCDKRYSLTDCISFVLMNQMGISGALAFDRNFTQAGFQRLP